MAHVERARVLADRATALGLRVRIDTLSVRAGDRQRSGPAEAMHAELQRECAAP